MTAAGRLPAENLPLPEIFQSARTAVEIEAGAAASGGRSIELTDGRLIAEVGLEQTWSFTVDEDVDVAPETPGTLKSAQSSTVARLVAVGDQSVVVSVVGQLPEPIDRAELAFDLDFLWRRLAERLGAARLDGDAAPLLESLLDGIQSDVAEEVTEGPRTLDEEQEIAASRAIGPGARFTWGPPGTGKTKVLADAVRLAVEGGARVLLVAHANAAVDVAMTRVATTLGAADDPGTRSLITDGKVLRVGTPSAELGADHPDLVPETVVARAEPDLGRALNRLTRARAHISDALRRAADDDGRREAHARLEALRREADDLRRSIVAATNALVEQATVVGTTLAKLVVDDRLWEWPADVVIVDEASMVGMATILAVASRGSETLSFFGDFRQLPPICRSNESRALEYLGTDVFEFAGVTGAYEQGIPDPRLSVLRTQFRMGEQICGVVNDLSYAGLLRTHTSARNRGIRLAELEPCPGAELVLVDLSGCGAACSTDVGGSFSRLNLLSAAVSTSLAHILCEHGAESVGVLSPYRAQMRLLAGMLHRDPELTAATIHRFQGSELDAIVLDLTDGFDQPGPSRLTGNDPELACRLLNVAVSRAKGKVVLAVDRSFVEERHRQASPTRRLIDKVADAGEVLAAGDVTAAACESARAAEWMTWAAATDLLGDAASAGEPIELNMGRAQLDPAAVGSALRRAAGQRIKVRGTRFAVSALERLALELSLIAAGPTPWAVLGDDRLLVGSLEWSGPVAMLRSRRACQVVRRHLTAGG